MKRSLNNFYRLVDLENVDEVDPQLSLHPVPRLLAGTMPRSEVPVVLNFPPLFSKGRIVEFSYILIYYCDGKCIIEKEFQKDFNKIALAYRRGPIG